MYRKIFLTIIVLFSLSLQGLVPFCIPISSSNIFGLNSDTQAGYFPSISEFAFEISSNPSSASLSGIYVENILADRIVQQPIGNPGYVSNEEDTVTQFSMATHFGTIGILAHNTAAGAAFFELELDDVIYLVQSSGKLQSFIVKEIQEYQAIWPNNTYSDFFDLRDPSSLISAQTLFLIHTAGAEFSFFKPVSKTAGIRAGEGFLLSQNRFQLIQLPCCTQGTYQFFLIDHLILLK